MNDVVIVGGGIIGASIAYFLSKENRKVKVFERDPTYKNASFPLSLGGFRRQFFQKENILLGHGRPRRSCFLELHHEPSAHALQR